MSAQALEAIRKRLVALNDGWPREPKPDGQAEILERRLARAVGDSEIIFATATVDGGRGISEPRRYVATLFTENAVVSGKLTVGEGASYPPAGDVRIIPRKALRGLILHHIDPGEPEIVSFTAMFDGLEPVVVGLPQHGRAGDGGSSSLFDSLRADLFGSSPVTAARG